MTITEVDQTVKSNGWKHLKSKLTIQVRKKRQLYCVLTLFYIFAPFYVIYFLICLQVKLLIFTVPSPQNWTTDFHKLYIQIQNNNTL